MLYINKFESGGPLRCWTNSLEEVGCGCSGRYDTIRVRDGAEQFGLPSVDVIEDHDRCNVSAAVAVVGRRPHRNQLLVKHELVTFMNQLMSTADELQVVNVDKLQHKRYMLYFYFVSQRSVQRFTRGVFQWHLDLIMFHLLIWKDNTLIYPFRLLFQIECILFCSTQKIHSLIHIWKIS